MAINDGIAFWNALKVKVKSLIKQDTFNCLRMERYDVTTAPNGTTIGVTMPEGGKEINIPYSKDVANATIGDTVMVGWRGSMSTARAMWFGKGYSGGVTPLDIYPIGSIYMSVNSVDPGTLFGGTWQRLQDTFLLAAGSSYSAGSTGGQANHSHEYGLQYGGYYSSVSLESNQNAGLLNYDNSNNISVYTGSLYAESVSQPINSSNTTSSKNVSCNSYRIQANSSYTSNLPPYLAVYMWKRTA